MKITVIVIALLAVAYSFAYGQVSVDSISTKRGVFGDYRFYQGNKRLDIFQLVNTMKSNERAYQQIRSARLTFIVAMI